MEVLVILLVIMGILGLVSYLLAESLKKDKEKAIKGGYYDEFKATVEKAQGEVEYGKGYGIKCPNCGQVNVKTISTVSRAISVGTVGLASGKIGKTYKCPKCGYMW